MISNLGAILGISFFTLILSISKVPEAVAAVNLQTGFKNCALLSVVITIISSVLIFLVFRYREKSKNY